MVGSGLALVAASTEALKVVEVESLAANTQRADMIHVPSRCHTSVCTAVDTEVMVTH